MTGRPISALCLFIGLVLRPKRRDVVQTAYPHAAWLLVFAEPSLAAAEMIMCICALVTSVVVVITPLRMMVQGGGSGRYCSSHLPGLRGNSFSATFPIMG